MDISTTKVASNAVGFFFFSKILWNFFFFFNFYPRSQVFAANFSTRQIAASTRKSCIAERAMDANTDPRVTVLEEVLDI